MAFDPILYNKLNALNKLTKSIQDEINTLKETFNNDDISNLKSDVNTNTDDISNLKSDVNTNTDDISNLKSDVSTNKNDISNLKSDVNTNADDISNLKSDVSTNKNDISNLKSDVNTNADDISNLKSDVSTNKNDLNTLKLNIGTGNKDQTAFIKEDGSNEFYYDNMVKTGKFALDNSQLNLYLENTISQEEIFNEWYRFSHDGPDNFPANTDELDAWKYNDDGTISCTENTNTYVGFVSKNKYDYYDLEVNLSSTDGDNDRMGIVLAFHKDPETGKEYTLSAIRNNDNNDYSWMVIRNFMINNTHEDAWDFTKCDIIENKSDVISRADPDGWSNYDVGTKIKIQREGNNFKVWSSPAGSTDIDEDSLIEFNLDDDPKFDIFKGPKSYGFSALSQNDTTFSEIKFQDTNPNSISQYIFDTSTKEVYELNTDGSYSKSSTALSDILSMNKFYKDSETKQIFYFDGTNFDFINGNQYTWMQSNLSENGYTKLPNGLIMQWGRFTFKDVDNNDDVGNRYTFTIPFNIKFPNVCFNIQITGWNPDNNESNEHHYTARTDNTENFILTILRLFGSTDGSEEGHVSWFAIGM